MLIDGKTLLVEAPATVGVRVHKRSGSTQSNGDALELSPRTTGLLERETDDETRVLIRRSAWAGRPICTIGA